MKKALKKPLGICLIIVLFVASLSISALGANNVSDISVTVELLDDGSAYITQYWQGVFEMGTENYIPIGFLGDMDIDSFRVSDEKGEYVFTEKWNVKGKFEDKINKCGIVKTDNGYELCWGISEYGNKSYAIQYRVKGLIGSFTDADGFNFRFINDSMSTFPTNVNLKIVSHDGIALTDENCNVWAFGFDGQIGFSNNSIAAYSQSPLEGSNHMTIMVEFAKGLFHPLRQVNSSIEDLKSKAFDGSDYEDDSGYFILFIIFLALLVFAIVLIRSAIIKGRFKKFQKDAEYFRDTPNEGDMNGTYSLSKCFGLCDESAILGAVMLRLVNLGAISPLKNTEVKAFGRVSESVSLRLDKAPENGNEYDDYVYTLLESAAGQDRVLQQNELKLLCEKNNSPVRKFISSCQSAGDNYVVQKNCFKNLAVANIKALTDSGKKELGEIVGLKKYLLDFSLIKERDITETAVWQNYMVYAYILGIADKVMEQLKKLYPQLAPEIEVYSRNIYMVNHYNTFMYSSLYRAEQKRAQGSGGRASFGGGGGFSGGGSGGGSR